MRAAGSAAQSSSTTAAGDGGIVEGILRVLGRSSSFKGSGASRASYPARGGPSTMVQHHLTFVVALVCTLFFGIPPAKALADGNLDVTIAGTGSGTVTSTSQEASGLGTSVATPGEIDCNGPGPICSAHFDFDFFGLGHNGNVTLTATPAPGFVFRGWSESGATSSQRCTTPPATNATCVVALNGNPGPDALVTATFTPVPDPPTAMTDPASGVQDHFATLRGRINPAGDTPSGCYFEYGTSTDFGAVAPCVPEAETLGDGNDEVDVSAQTPRIEAGTTYYYRLVGENLGGTSVGQARSFTTSGTPVCENAARRLEQGINTVLLPNCMALEMVSPPAKSNLRANKPHISRNGQRVLFHSMAALADAPTQNSALEEPYVATRSQDGWITAPTAVPAGFSGGWNWPGHPRSFTPDFSGWFHIDSTPKDLPKAIGTVHRGDLTGGITVMSPLLIPLEQPSSHHSLSDSELAGASRDHSTLVFRAGTLDTRYVEGDPLPFGTGATRNTYVTHRDAAGHVELEVLIKDRHGKYWGGTCGASLGGVETPTGTDRGAISEDGSRMYVSARPDQSATGPCDVSNPVRILERIATPEGVEISEVVQSECAREEPEPPCAETDGDDLFQAASADGGVIYFTTTRQLASSDGDANSDLYLLDRSRAAGQKVLQVSARSGSDAPTTVSKVVAISGDGSRAYFTSPDALTAEPNPENESAVAGQQNLYVFERDVDGLGGAIAFIGAVVGGTDSEYAVPVTGVDSQGVRVGGDGSVLVFRATAALTADDEDGDAADLYRYDARSHELVRVSAAASGGSDNGSFSVQARQPSAAHLGTDHAEWDRWVSEDGQTIVFKTSERLVPGDDGGVGISYLWNDGELHRLPGTTDRPGPFGGGQLRDFPTVSHDGNVAAFTSFQRLRPQDIDSASDVYVARAGGGFRSPPASDDSCGAPCPSGGARPIDIEAATSMSAENGNVRPRGRLRLRVVKPTARQRRRAAYTGVIPVVVRSSRATRVSVAVFGRLRGRVRRIGQVRRRLTEARGTTVARVKLHRIARRHLRARHRLRIVVVVRSTSELRRRLTFVVGRSVR